MFVVLCLFFCFFSRPAVSFLVFGLFSCFWAGGALKANLFELVFSYFKGIVRLLNLHLHQRDIGLLSIATPMPSGVLRCCRCGAAFCAFLRNTAAHNSSNTSADRIGR